MILLFTLFCFNTFLFPQTSSYSSSEIYQGLKKLKVLGSVLYIAAHPDDENTALLTYMSKGKLTRTAYLSLTRGDGGQNLLGNEKGDLLGVIRTQELLSARKIDGAEQFFTRAIDFGYSKTANETLRNWDRDLVLGDVVKIIRKFRPDIILTRFSKTQGGHGHHLTSAILAEEAFYAAADPGKYPDQLETLKPWQAKRLYWNTWQPSDNAVSIDIGEYNSIIGKSFNEIAADARSMHKSQGFGVSPNRGTQLVHFNYFAGDSASNDLFDGIDLSWGRVEGGKDIENEIDKIINLYNPETPENIVPFLIELYKDIGNLKDKYWVDKKQDEVKKLIKNCAGLWMESIVWEPEISLGQNMDVRTTIINRLNYPIILEDVSTTFSNTDLDVSQKLEFNKPITVKQNILVPANYNYSQPYWLNSKHDGKLFTVENNELIGNPENKPDIISKITLKIDETSFSYEIPAIYKWVDAVKGELTKPSVIRPDLSISVDQENLVFANGSTKEIKVNIISKIDSAFGKIIIDLPKGWKSEVDDYNFSLNEKGDRTTFSFKVSPTNIAKTGLAKFRAILNGKTFTDEIVEIDYPHIQYQTVLKPVNVDLIKLEIEIEKKRIGYIMGSGDDIPLSLKELGYDLELLSDEDLDKKDLSEYDVIICGIRAFNTRPELDRQQKRIIEFVEKGGTWIVQHNTRFGINVDQIGPYPFSTTGRDRIAEEDAKIDILVPEHQIFNYPNKINSSDFDGWVQERGLYFANSWEGKLYPLLAGNDEGENSKLGGLLYANYGKGVFIFTAYSWFRQLPAGVPGAYKIFVNMISAKGE
jgi:LmbE family N-acetylglucosaminyl deacetylase